MGALHDNARCPCQAGTGDRIRDRQLTHPESANRQRDCCACAPADWMASLLLLPEQPELRGIARGFGEAEMAEGVGREQPSTRGALNEAFLNEEWLDDLLDRVARLRQCRRD